MELRISILGVGRMGKNHLRVLSMLEGVKVNKIFDINEAELQKISTEYGVQYTLDAKEAIKDADAVIIVTPTSTHFKYIELCAGAVKNVFVEKPLAETYAQAKEIQDLVENNSMNIQCGFIERFNPVISELKKIVEPLSIINLDLFRTNRLSNRITDVDVVLDLMIHDIDLSLYLNGPIENVVAHGKKENGLVAFSSALFQHANGSMSRLIASRITEKKMRSIQVTADDCYIDADLLQRDLYVNKQSSISKETESSYVISSSIQQIEVKPREALLEELKVFIARCGGDLSIDAPGIEAAVEAQLICKLVSESIENG